VKVASREQRPGGGGNHSRPMASSSADTDTATIAPARPWADQLDWVYRMERTAHEALIESLAALTGRCRALEARNRELGGEVRQLHLERKRLRSELAEATGSRTARASPGGEGHQFLAGEDERRRLERDLHDGVQNELVGLIVQLTLAQRDASTPHAVAHTLSGLVARAEAALHSVREIANGIYPSGLAGFGVLVGLRAQARRASLEVRLVGSAPRSTEDAEVAVYFSCLEAIQNVAKHGGPDASVAVRFTYDDGTLVMRIVDDGDGFDSARTPEGGGLKNIRERIQSLGGTVALTSQPGQGTVIRVSLPWPARHGDSSPLASAVCVHPGDAAMKR
jgi:signal transduction histidine kinase